MPGQPGRPRLVPARGECGHSTWFSPTALPRAKDHAPQRGHPPLYRAKMRTAASENDMVATMTGPTGNRPTPQFAQRYCRPCPERILSSFQNREWEAPRRPTDIGGPRANAVDCRRIGLVISSRIVRPAAQLRLACLPPRYNWARLNVLCNQPPVSPAIWWLAVWENLREAFRLTHGIRPSLSHCDPALPNRLAVTLSLGRGSWVQRPGQTLLVNTRHSAPLPGHWQPPLLVRLSLTHGVCTGNVGGGMATV